MRTLDPILESALSEQQGAIILRVNTWTDAADYTSNPTAPDHVWTCRSFEIGATTAEAELVTENDYTLSAFTVFTIERGVKLSGTEYTIESGLMHVRKYKEEYGKISITGSSYPNQKINITAGDGTYQEVIEAFCTAISKTAVFKNSTDAWLNYQFLPTGKSLSLNKAELFENLLKQKYCILVYEESPNNLVFYNQDSYESSSLSAITENSGALVAVASEGVDGGQTSTDGTTWTPRALPSFYNDVTYGNSIYVAVGASVCATSSDGITWTARTIPAGTYNAVIYGNSLFVAVGAGVCATSSDGITWTARTIKLRNWQSVIWSTTLSLFVAISDIAATSTDGITWTNNTITFSPTLTTVNLPTTGDYWGAPAWSPELSLFAAIAGDGSYKFATSPDGVTWTARSSTVQEDFRSICWSPDLTLFCAVAITGTAANRIATSPDGITWTARTAPEANSWLSVCWSTDLTLFCAVSADGTNRVMTSPDGTTWTARSAAEANTWRSIVWSSSLGLFVAIANTGTNRVMTSPDGTTWTARSISTKTWMSVTWSATLGLFAAVATATGSDTQQVATSTDGTTWTIRTVTANLDLISVVYADSFGLFVAIGSIASSAKIITSPDGTTWTETDVDYTGYNAISYSPELDLILITGANGHAAIAGAAESESFHALTETSGTLAAVGNNICKTSTNGTTWTTRTIPTGIYYGITYGNSIYIAVGAGVCASSSDGVTWTARTPAALNTWQDVLYSSTLSLFVAVASNGASKTMTSPNGITWTPSPAESEFDLSYTDGPTSYLDRQQAAVHFIWRDEDAALHTSGDTTYPQWNLGFLASTDSPPTTREDAYYKIFLQKAPVRLDITDGDKIHFTPYWSIDPSRTIDAMMQVTEHFNTKASPSWYQEIRSIVLFDKTEGGALPSTIERVAAYTPLVSTGFDGNLTPSVNNLQALAQAVDDLPRSLTTTERDAIATPRAGLTIYNSTTLKLNFYDGSAWRVVTST